MLSFILSVVLLIVLCISTYFNYKTMRNIERMKRRVEAMELRLDKLEGRR